MKASARIKQVMLEREMSVSQLADKMNISPRTLTQKLQRDTFPYWEFVQIMDLLECDVVVVTRDTKKMF